MQINTVINYSSQDNAFIKDVIAQAKQFSEVVQVVSYDKFFDGTPDNNLIDFNVREGKNVKHDILVFDKDYSARFHHNMARWKGYKLSQDTFQVSHTLFLDGDEVVDAKKFIELKKQLEPEGNYKLANYWYYRDTIYQAYQVEDSATLVRTLSIRFDNFFTEAERDALVENWTQRYTTLNSKPVVHHYSWAKPKEQLYKKIKTWAHKNDMNWKGMLDKEFSGRFNYTCTFNGYHFKKVEPFVNFTFGQE